MGRVRAMFDDLGNKLKDATPGQPVEVLGFQGVPQAGDSFQVFKDEFKARSIVAFRQTKAREMATQSSSRLSLEQLFSKIQQGEIRELPIIIKADVQGSFEVLSEPSLKLELKKSRSGSFTAVLVQLLKATFFLLPLRMPSLLDTTFGLNQKLANLRKKKKLMSARIQSFITLRPKSKAP